MRVVKYIIYAGVLIRSFCGYGQSIPMPMDSVAEYTIRDSLRKTLYFIDTVGPHWRGIPGMATYHIEHTYVCGRRGMSDEEWTRRTRLIMDKVNSSGNDYIRYVFAFRYLGLLTHDAHFKFPDIGQLNRSGFFQQTDTIFPVWVKTWKDGSVYSVNDYSGLLPPNSRILSVNGHVADEMALTSRALSPGEEANAMAMMNAQHEPDPRTWCNFTNFMFTEGITAPYTVAYTPLGTSRVDTIVLQGITRGSRFKQYKKSGDKYRNEATILHLPDGKKNIEYENRGGGIGVLSINSFWGRNIIELFMFGRDWRFKKQLKRAMRRIDHDEVTDLVLDMSENMGGMEENVYYTLDYFTDRSVSYNKIYHVTDLNREIIKKNISNSPEILDTVQDSLIGYVDKLASGTVFVTDTICPLSYMPSNPKHKYTGKVYLLTGPMTYSAGQMFVQYCQKLDVGPVVGEHSGGYMEITSGNAMPIPQSPQFKWLSLAVPFVATRICEEDAPYDYPPVDIPIEQTFEEWMEGKNHNLDRLIEMIRSDDDAIKDF